MVLVSLNCAMFRAVQLELFVSVVRRSQLGSVVLYIVVFHLANHEHSLQHCRSEDFVYDTIPNSGCDGETYPMAPLSK